MAASDLIVAADAYRLACEDKDQAAAAIEALWGEQPNAQGDMVRVLIGTKAELDAAQERMDAAVDVWREATKVLHAAAREPIDPAGA